MTSIDLHQQDWDWGNAVARLDLGVCVYCRLGQATRPGARNRQSVLQRLRRLLSQRYSILVSLRGYCSGNALNQGIA
jgi:hypothetical protein